VFARCSPAGTRTREETPGRARAAHQVPISIVIVIVLLFRSYSFIVPNHRLGIGVFAAAAPVTLHVFWALPSKKQLAFRRLLSIALETIEASLLLS
jgi:hypothetical protein